MANSVIKKVITEPKAGTQSITVAADSSGYVDVTFERPFPSGTIYAVNISQIGEFAYIDAFFSASNRSYTGFRLNVSSKRNTETTFSLAWSAVPI